jgi:hypothetical protein
MMSMEISDIVIFMDNKVLLGITKTAFLVGFSIYISTLVNDYFMETVSRKCSNIAGIATCWPIETLAILLPPLLFIVGGGFLLSKFRKIIPKNSILIFGMGTFTILCFIFLMSLNLSLKSWQLPIIYPAVFVGYYLLFGVFL